MLSVLGALIALIWIPVMAVGGKGYRGLYGGAGFGLLLLSLMVGILTPSRADIRRLAENPVAVNGARTMAEYFPGLSVFLAGCAVGSFIGAAVFRSTRAAQPSGDVPAAALAPPAPPPQPTTTQAPGTTTRLLGGIVVALAVGAGGLFALSRLAAPPPVLPTVEFNGENAARENQA